MNKSLLSQVLDGAAFPAIMLAVGISEIKVGPHRKKALRHDKEVAVELQVEGRAEAKLRKCRHLEVVNLPYAYPVQEQKPGLRAQHR
jgi:hypothetical protein